MNGGILADTKTLGCSLKNVHFWQRDTQTAPLCQQERLLASPAPLHARNQEGKCSQNRKTAAVTYWLYPILNWEFLLPLPASFHTVTESPKLLVSITQIVPYFPLLQNTRIRKWCPVPNKGHRCTELVYHNCHLQGTLLVTPPKSSQSRGCPAWMLHYRAAVLWWSRVRVVTTQLKFCFQHTSGLLGAKCFSLSP